MTSESDYTVERPSPVRRMIAARVTETKQSIPHFRLSIDVEVDALMAHRNALLALHPQEPVSLNDLLVKATAEALMTHPELNIQWVDGNIHRYRSADISVVMDSNEGIRTPIVREANNKSVFDIAREIRDFKVRAAKGLLKTSEILGGSFSISNLGMYGIDRFDAIINPPQCAILAVGRIRESLVMSDEGTLGVESVTHMTLSLDHRALDGVMGARFLSTLARVIGKPAAA